MAYQQPGYNPNMQNPPPQHAYHPAPPIMPRGMMMNAMENGGNGDPDGKYSIQFNDRSIRAAFIRKVFAIIFLMLLVVTIMTAYPWFNTSAMRTIRYNQGIYLGGYVIFFATYLSLACCQGVRRKFPMNIIVTIVFTLATGVMTSCICAHHSIQSVLLALAITTISTLGIVLIACQTKFDITAHSGYLAIASLVFMAFSFIATIAVIFFKATIMMSIFSFLGALLFMAYMMFDIQMLMGGRKLELSPEDYIFAAVEIFLDIIQLFWMILSFIGNSD